MLARDFGKELPAIGIPAGFEDPSGNLIAAKTDAQGRLLTVASGGATGGTSAIDESAFTLGADSITPNGGLYNDSATALTSGQVGVARSTPNRAEHVNLRNNAGTEIATASNAVRVDPTGTTAQPVKLQDGSGNPISATGTSLNVNITGGGSGGGAVTVADGADVTEGAIADAKVVGDNSGTVSAKLRGLNTTLTSVDGKTPALGQALAAASVPVVLTAAQVTTLTPPAAITNFANETGGNLASLVTQIGAVTASPTANTVMDRLKALLTGIVLSAGSAIIGKVGIDQTTPGTTNLVAAVGAAASGASKAGNPVQVGAVYNSTQPTVTTGQMVEAQATARGARIVAAGVEGLDVNNAKVSGTAIDTNSGNKSAGTQRIVIATDQPQLTNAFLTAPQAIASGGATPYELISAASTNATSVKGSAGTIYSVAVFNLNAAQRYLKLYNKSSAPTVGSDTPVQTYMIPGNTAGAGLTISFPVGINFSSGIAFALTTGMAVADTGAVAATEICVNLTYL